jgi:hypothetical protein
MNKKVLYVTWIALALTALLTASVEGREIRLHRTADIRDLDRTPYNVLNECAYMGTVGSTGHLLDGIMYFPLKTATGVIDVHLGPRSFFEESKFKLKVGEIISVIGAPATIKGRQVLLAREIRSLTAVFVGRDRNGEPLWDSDRPVQMDPESTFMNEEMCEIIVP